MRDGWRMGIQLWTNPLGSATTDGPALTAAAAASCLPAAARFVLPNGFFYAGKQLRITASGRISCAAGTPGTARYEVRLGNTAVFDGQAIALNVAGKTNAGWWLDILLTCRTIGASTAATLLGQGRWTSEAGIGAPLPSAGGNAMFTLPVNGSPGVGAGFDSTAALPLDLFFAQTVATGSMTLHQYLLEEIG
jgi:hypothetical protein